MIKLILVLVAFFTLSLSAQNTMSFANEPLILTSLESLKDDNLQANLVAALNKDRNLQRLIKQKKLAVGIIDLKDPCKERYAAVNGSNMMYAASLPKIAVLLAAVDAMYKGELFETPGITRDMNLMIRKSNNAASTRMIDRVGYEKIEAVMAAYQLYDKQKGGGLWVGKRYAAAGKRHPEPLKGLSHAASVDAVCKYYYMLAKGTLVSSERSQQMKNILANPGLHHKFVNTLDKVAPKAKLYRKSGSWKTFHSDSVWVNGPERNYILVALIDNIAGEQIARRLVKIAERAMNGDKLAISK